jgi:methionyl-tRNA formyltransferase
MTDIQDLKAGQYVIQILTDSGGWMVSFVETLKGQLEDRGHSVMIASHIDDAVPADFCFCLSYSQIVKRGARARYTHTLVVHESDLPQGRGWSPMTWQILEGKHRIAVTLLEAVDKVDAGPIYAQEWIELDGSELSAEWRQLQGNSTIRLVEFWVDNYPSILEGISAQSSNSSYYARRDISDSKLDLHRSLAEQFNLLRVVDNERYPAFFEMNGHRYVIKIEKEEKK